MTQLRKRSKKKIILFTALALVLFLIAFVGVRYTLDMRAGNEKLTKMTAIADKFNPPKEWVLESETRKEPNVNWFCSTGGCPSIQKNWDINPAIPVEDISVIIGMTKGLGLNPEKVTGCIFDVQLRSCHVEGEYDGISISFSLWTQGGGNNYSSATLRIE